MRTTAEQFETTLTPFTTHKLPYDAIKTASFAKKFVKDMPVEKELDMRIFKAVLPVTFCVEACTGYASASKTTRVIEKYPDALFISPTRALSLEHNKLGVVSFTQHTALDRLNTRNPAVVVIDEVSKFALEYICMVHAIVPNALIVLVGDIFQTPPEIHDFKYTSILTTGIENNLNVVYKIPQDVCTMLNDKFKFAMRSASEHVSGLCTITKEQFDRMKDTQIICFNDSTCKTLVKKGYKCNTITTYQGSRADRVIFYIDGKSVTSQLVNRPEWIYTAMSRSKKELVLYGDKQYICQYFKIDGTNIRNLEEVSGISLTRDLFPTVIENLDHNVPSMVNVHNEGTSTADVPLPHVVDILTKIIQPVNEATASHAFLQPLDLPKVLSGKLSVNQDNITHVHRNFKGYQLLPEVPLVKAQVSSDPKETVRTLITRYSKNIKRAHDKTLRINTGMLLRGLCKAVYGNDHNLTKLKFDLRSTPEELRYHYKEYLIALSKKEIIKNAKNGVPIEIDQELIEYDETIAFMMKRQSKFDPKEAFDASDKAGQGIAALSKKINLIFSAYSRFLIDRLRIIARNNKRNIIFATHESDEAISAQVASFLDASDCDHPFFMCDVSEWDASFNNSMANFTSELMRYIGVPDYLNDWFSAFRAHWRMVIHHKYGTTKLEGHDKQFSGQPFTIVENTLANLALINLLFDFTDVMLQLYKGDDSGIQCKSFTPTVEGKEFIAQSLHQLKILHNNVGEFASFFVNRYGYFPDLVRRVSRFLGCTYRDPLHLEQAKINVKNCLSVVKSEHQLNLGCVFTSQYYGKDKITPEQVKQLFYFAKTVDDIKFLDLFPVSKPVLSC
jgi:hypothetical protein